MAYLSIKINLDKIQVPVFCSNHFFFKLVHQVYKYEVRCFDLSEMSINKQITEK